MARHAAYCGALKARLCNATDGGRAVTLNSAKLVKQRGDSVAARALSAPAHLRCYDQSCYRLCYPSGCDRLCYVTEASTIESLSDCDGGSSHFAGAGCACASANCAFYGADRRAAHRTRGAGGVVHQQVNTFTAEALVPAWYGSSTCERGCFERNGHGVMPSPVGASPMPVRICNLSSNARAGARNLLTARPCREVHYKEPYNFLKSTPLHSDSGLRGAV
eukprot:scaffold61490_cov70-Phaeocystis_antarctica.AAC.2